jgi:electron transfer flavoprotein beta subunit
MKLLVVAKRVPDPEAKIRVKPDGNSIVTEQLKFVINPFDEIAVEEALRIKEKLGGEVVVLSVGPAEAAEQVRTALAMGADRGVLIKADGVCADPGIIARALAEVAKQEGFDVLLMGKQAVDTDYGQTCGMLAQILGVPYAAFACKVEVEGESKRLAVVREVDGGLETKLIGMPCIVTADLRLNEPRYASLPGIMKAKKKEIRQVSLEELGVGVTPKLRVESLEEPPKRQGGRKVGSVEELVRALHDEAKVI